MQRPRPGSLEELGVGENEPPLDVYGEDVYDPPSWEAYP